METILVVDDTSANIKILIALLGDDYDVMACRDGETALELAREEKPDLILLDIMMPSMNGFDVCKALKSETETKDIPIIFLTAKIDEDSIAQAYSLGGSDYIKKPFIPKELRARVNRELQLISLQNELKLLASTDSMTKLYNRRHFAKISEHILDLARRDKGDLSLIIIDLDKFKKVNDTYGHKVGDEVIIKFAELLQKEQRKSDIVCRFGGEEFVILLPETDIKGAQVVAEKIRKRTEETKISLGDDKSFHFTVSLGISNVDVKDEKNIEAALQRADEALYEAKNSGRNRVCTLYI